MSLLLLFNQPSAASYTLSADGGVYSYSGNNATLTYATSGAYTLSADGGVYSYSGNNATLTYTPAGAFVLSADGGVYAYAGNNVNLTFSGTPIIVDDTHDGDYLPRKFKRERDERKKRKRDIINAYEILVEGKSPVIEELIAQYADPVKPTAKIQAPQLNIDKLLNNADAAQKLWDAYIDMDDEEILLLL